MQQDNDTQVGATIGEFNNSWKGRGNLAQLVQELERQKESRVDFVADVTCFFLVRASSNA